jgi:hypothetical protein
MGDWPAGRCAHWGENEWWQAQIDAAVSGPDPVLCNLRITLAHQELSLALRRITGECSGANFHTWAVWGSKKAGQTIREEELSRVPRTSSALGMRRFVDQAAAHIFAGNVTVIADIGRQTARFVSAFADPRDRQPALLEDFLSGLRPGPVKQGGQDLLRGAYRHYFDAARATDADHRDELMLCANLLAILHEHQRLDPYIDASVPRPLRLVVTKHLLSFTVGSQAMRVSEDVPAPGPSPFPETLRTIEDPELECLLCGPQGWDRTPDSLAGSAARDWTELSDRMNFIVDLFRSRQTDPDLFTSPYTDDQRTAILAGRLPSGPL